MNRFISWVIWLITRQICTQVNSTFTFFSVAKSKWKFEMEIFVGLLNFDSFMDKQATQFEHLLELIVAVWGV